ncbi:putative late blight resistance protein homolog R1A-3 isoform X2 [Capsicum annuum]|uniref:putative late blight resistance protein homolog R1A-3 isoform X2 n=1 Tax=Capsicum annuum TaxID=4072 RepID=UPI001FB12B7F|nr:putative late blight resistance protein homolog R1A-3 isoform X2 [Capsicum annuum]
MEREKENEGKREDGEANSSSVSSAMLREDIVNLHDFIERLKIEEDQIVLDTDRIEKLKLELTFLSACLQLCYYISDGSNAKMSCISYKVHDLVQSLFHQRGDYMLVKLKDHVVPRLLENIKSFIISHRQSESSATMTEEKLVELLDAVLVNLHYLPKVRAELFLPSMTQYELLQNVFGNLRDFHGLKVNGCVEHKAIEYVLPQLQLMAERVGHFCLVLLSYQLDKTDETDEEDVDETDGKDDETDEEDEDGLDHMFLKSSTFEVSQVNSMLVHLLLKITPVSLEVMHICSTILEASKSAEVGHFIKQLLEASPDILREHLIHLQEHMFNAIPRSTSASNIHVMIEFLLIILTDMPKDLIHYEKLFVLLARVGELIREVSILIRNLEENSTDEENMKKISCASQDLLENIELLKEDLRHVFLESPADSSQLCFPMSDGPLFMTLLLRNLNDLLNSNAYSVTLIKEEISRVKEDLEHIRSFFGNVEQELHRDLWTRVLDVAYEAEHAINSILARDRGLLQLIFLLPETVGKIKLVRKEVQEKISKNMSIIFANSPNKPVINKSSIASKIIVGFEEETEWIIQKLTSGPAEVDVISIVGMPGLGKTTLAYRVYTEKSVVGHFDVRAWCTVDQERNEKKLLQKVFNEVIGLKERVSEDDIDDDVADKLRRQLFGKRYLIVLDDLWDTATWDELTRPLYAIPSEFQKGSRVILTSRKKEVALHGKFHSDPLDLRLLRPEESWELFEKKVFGEERCPDELKDVGEKIAEKCDGLPLVLDLIGGVISRKEKKEALWIEVLNNLSSFIFKDEEEVMKVIQLSYDNLSDHLKPCFLYLASYPKDEDIVISLLKELWTDEGLVEPTDLKSVEEVTEIYVDELISSSLVIVRGGSEQSCQIHDLVHDFCSIKSRQEKLFDLTSSIVLSSSSSDLMLRRRAISFDEGIYSDDSSFFSPEKRNPCAKHLLSLKIESGFLYNWHLRHLRLLKRLELRYIMLTDTALNEIGMLVHLRCLRIWMDAKALPLSFSNLCNLDTLVVENSEPNLVLSPTIWSLAKLRYVQIERTCSVFGSDIHKPTKLENLTTLSLLKLSCSVDSENIFKRFPNLRTLDFSMECSAPEQIYFPRLDVLNKLEMVSASFKCRGRTHVHQFDFHFPSSLKVVYLVGFHLASDELSRIGRSLPNLQKLRLYGASIEGGKEWNMEQVTFHNLKSLQLVYMCFSEWQVIADESFPVLEKLYIPYCTDLIEIPESFGDIASLKFITVSNSPQLKESALKIKEYVEEMTGEDKLEVEY